MSFFNAALLSVSAQAILGVLAYLRYRLLAGQFGVTHESDVLLLSLSIPILLALTVSGNIDATYLRHYYLDRDNRKHLAFCLASAVILLILTLCLALLSPLLAGIFRLPDSGPLTRLLCISSATFFFFCMSMVTKSIFLANEQFYLFNIGTLFHSILFYGLLFCVATVDGVIYVFVFAYLLQFLFVFVCLYYRNMRKTGLFVDRKLFLDCCGIWKSNLWVICAMIILAGGFFLPRMFVARVDPGAISALNYAEKLIQLPNTVITASLYSILLPYLYKSRRSSKALQGNLIALTLIITIPACIAMYLLDTRIVSAAYTGRHFDASAADMVAKAFDGYIPSFLTLMMLMFYLKLLLSRDKYREVFIGAILSFGSLALMGYYLTAYYGVAGGGLAYSLSCIVPVFYWATVLNRRGIVLEQSDVSEQQPRDL